MILKSQVALAVATPSAPSESPESDGLARHILAGYLMIASLILVIFGWMGTTHLAGAVIGAGRVIVKSEEKLVQHPTGGVVGQILVQEGARVREGDVLLRLDDTALKANLAIIDADLSALYARLARLRAERDGAAEVRFPDKMVNSSSDADRDSIHTEGQVFRSRRETQANRRQQLMERISQLREQVKGNALMIDGRRQEITLVNEALSASSSLLSKQLATRTQSIQYQQTVARLEGDVGNMTAEKGRLLAQISETELQISGMAEEMRSEVLKDLRETEAKIAEGESRRIAARDQLSRVDIRAPVDGVVHETVVHTVGGVINPGEAVMKIVPANQPLLFEVRINPTDIDQVHVGQKATLKFPAFNRSKTPEVTGKITLVGADASIDKQTGRSFYEVWITPEEAMSQKFAEKGVELVPGMPAEAYMETDERTALSYLLKPLTDQIMHAFREE